MAEECFDLLNSKGEKIGIQKERSLVHRDGDWHRAVHIWIYRPDGQILLQRRCKTKDSFPNMLDISCAGHLVAGDDSLTGALRELEEELGLLVSPESLRFVTTLKGESERREGWYNREFADVYFLQTKKSAGEMHFQKEEISEIFFVSPKRLREMIAKKQKDLIMHQEEFDLLLNFLARETNAE